MQAVLAGGVARVVYRSAVASVPQDLLFRARFLAAPGGVPISRCAPTPRL